VSGQEKPFFGGERQEPAKETGPFLVKRALWNLVHGERVVLALETKPQEYSNV
jgi:hypothetical protein